MNRHVDIGGGTLAKTSPLFWFTLAIPIAIVGLGINFLFNPLGASTGYGIPVHDPAAFPCMEAKGICEIFAGLVILPFLWRGDRRTTALLLAIAISVPIGDGLVILTHLGFAPPIYIHWGTASYMAILVGLLVRSTKSSELEMSQARRNAG